MGLLKHFRSRARLRSQQELAEYPKPKGPDRVSLLPDAVLRLVFSRVCPSVTDETFKVNEKSLIGRGCSLCDLRDLADCAKVNHKFYSLAQPLLYHSVRIDAVHFCPHEEELAELRKKSKIDPGEIPAIRLRLFQRTVWRNSQLAAQVLFLKLPYMTRETCVPDLARVVVALPNLRHVDLPDGFFSADAASSILRDELQASCPEIRRMVYKEGAELAFEMLAQHKLWLNLESLTLECLDIDLSVLRIVLASMPVLHEVKLRDMPRLDDMAFQSTPNLPDFPPLQKMQIRNAPGITSQGLATYLSRPETREVLSSLGLTNTGITVPTLHHILDKASHLTHLSVVSRISRGMPLEPVAPLASTSLQILNFEVLSSDASSAHANNASHSYAYGHGYSTTPLVRPTDSYYTYLSACIVQNNLPNLTRLFVRDSSFPDLLLLPPSSAHGARSRDGGAGFHQLLEIYTKGDEDLDWVFTPFNPHVRNSGTHHHSNSTSSGLPRAAPAANPVPEISGLALEPPSAPFTGLRNSYVAHPHVRQGSGSGSGSGSLTVPGPPPSSAGSNGSGAGRPVSAYGAAQQAGGLGPRWGVGEARMSVMLGDGMGGFTQVAAPAPPVMPAALEEGGYRRASTGHGSRPGSSGSFGGSNGRERPGSSSGGGGGGGGFLGLAKGLKSHGRNFSGVSSKGDLWR